MDAKGRESEPVCIDDEISFEIPEGWEWARLCDIADFAGGKTPSTNDKSNYADNGILWVTSKDMKRDFIDSTLITLSEKGASELTLYEAGTILMVTRSGILRRTLPVAMLKKPATVNQDQKAICPFDKSLSLWMLTFLKASDLFIRQNYSKTGTTVESIVFDKVKTMLVPVPPLAEQRRIAELVSGLMPLVDEYGKLEEEREALDAALPERLRKSILQMAVEGMLVPQDPSDEPASVLLDRIREERARLVKEKKIKAPKGGESVIYLGSDGRRYEKRVDSKGHESEPVCVDDEIPFDIPEGWEWARLCNLADFAGGNTPLTSDKSNYADNGVLWVTSKDMKRDLIDSTIITLSEKGASSLTLFQPGTLLMVTRSGILRRLLPVAMLTKPATVNQDQKAICPFDSKISPWLLIFFKASDMFIRQNFSKAGTTVESIVFDRVKTMVVPIPPLAEQRRIVERLDSVLANTD